MFGQFTDRELIGITKIDRPGSVAIHQAEQTVDQIIDIAEGTALAAVAIKGDRLTAQGLDDEIAHHAPIVRKHARTVGVEDARNTDLTAMQTLVVKTEGFRDALSLVITGANSSRIDAATVILMLRMNLRVAIHLTCGGEQQAGLHATGEAEHVVSAEKTSFGGFDWIVLVVNGGCRTGEMPNPVNLKLDRFGDVMQNELKTGMIKPLADVGLSASRSIIETDHIFTLANQTVDQMGTEKTSATRNQITRSSGGHTQTRGCLQRNYS